MACWPVARRLLPSTLAAAATAILVLAPLSPVRACSGAPGVRAADLEAHPGPVFVGRVVERVRDDHRRRSIVVAVEERLRGAGPEVLRLERPLQASGVCHDAFTVWRNTRLLIAFDVRPLGGGGPLMPAWTIAKDGSLRAIYDDPPYPTLEAARTALAATQPRTTMLSGQESLAAPIVSVALGLGVLALAAAWGRRAVRR